MSPAWVIAIATTLWAAAAVAVTWVLGRAATRQAERDRTPPETTQHSSIQDD